MPTEIPKLVTKFGALYNQNCLEGMKNIKSGSVDGIFTDLPYGSTACAWDVIIPFEQMWYEFKRITKPNGAIVLFGMEPFSSLLRCSNLADYKYDLYLKKPNASNPYQAKVRPMRTVETISVFSNGGGATIYNPQMREGKPYKWNSKRSGGDAANIKFKEDKPIINTGTRYPIDLLEFKQERGLHATQKSVELMEWLIKTYTNDGDLIVDACAGSATTCISAINTNREFLAYELTEHYFDVGSNRILKHIDNKGVAQ